MGGQKRSEPGCPSALQSSPRKRACTHGSPCSRGTKRPSLDFTPWRSPAKLHRSGSLHAEAAPPAAAEAAHQVLLPPPGLADTQEDVEMMDGPQQVCEGSGFALLLV